MKKLIINLHILFFLCCTLAVAQEKKSLEPYKNWEIGINAGVESYNGAYVVSQEARFNHFFHWQSGTKLKFGATAKKKLPPIIRLEGMGIHSNLSCSWNNPSKPTTDFQTDVNRYNRKSVWNLTNLLSQNKYERKIYWYTKIGIGTLHFPKKTFANPLTDQQLKLPTIQAEKSLLFHLDHQRQLIPGTQWSLLNTDRLDGHKTKSINIE